jgi:hypothetical protein
MRDVVRFTLRLAAGLLLVFGLIFWGVGRDGVTTGDALAYATVSSVSVMVGVVLMIWGAALVGGWGVRRRALRTMDVGVKQTLEINSTDDVLHHMRQLDGVPPLLQLPWGLTLSVSEEALGIWVGRREPHELLHLPWGVVHSVDPVQAQRRWDGEWCLNVVVLTPGGLVPLRFPLLGGFPFGALPASLRTTTEVAHRLRSADPTTRPQ